MRLPGLRFPCIFHEPSGASSVPWRQSWLCAPRPEDAMPLLQRVHLVSGSGFSAEDDFAEDDPFAPLREP